MKKILLLITRLDRGGSADLTLQLARGLSERGYRVLLVSGKTENPAYDPQKFADEHGFQLHFFPSLVRDINPFKDTKALIQIYQKIVDFKPNILHTNSSKAGFIGRIAGYLAGVSEIYHSPHGHIFYGYHSKFISKFFIILEKLAAKLTTNIFNLTQQGKKDHIKEKIASPEKFKVSSCGVDLAPFSNKNFDNGFGKRFTICWIGRFVDIKNPEMLLKTAQIIQSRGYKFNYQMVGNGPELKDMKRLAKKLNLENFSFKGYQEDVLPILSKSNLFVLTSKNEGFGRVIVEAMAAGLPIIATSVGGVPDIITEGKNGFLIPAGDTQKLAEKIIQTYQNKDLYIKMSQNNKSEANKYSIDNYINNIEILYGN